MKEKCLFRSTSTNTYKWQYCKHRCEHVCKSKTISNVAVKNLFPLSFFSGLFFCFVLKYNKQFKRSEIFVEEKYKYANYFPNNNPTCNVYLEFCAVPEADLNQNENFTKEVICVGNDLNTVSVNSNQKLSIHLFVTIYQSNFFSLCWPLRIKSSIISNNLISKLESVAA